MVGRRLARRGCGMAKIENEHSFCQDLSFPSTIARLGEQSFSRSRMPRVSQEHEQEVRDRIVRAALQVFAERGFHRATMQDIVRASGLSVGAIYTYFKSKSELILAGCDLITDHERRILALIETLLAARVAAPPEPIAAAPARPYESARARRAAS